MWLGKGRVHRLPSAVLISVVRGEEDKEKQKKRRRHSNKMIRHAIASLFLRAPANSTVAPSSNVVWRGTVDGGEHQPKSPTPNSHIC